MPLVAVAAEESVEILKAEAVWPKIKRACLARHPVRHIVHLAEPRRVKSVFPEHSADGAGTRRNERVIARKAGCKLGDNATGGRMVVASRNQRGPGGRAQRGRVVHVVAKPAVRHPLEVGSLDRASEGAGRSKTHVVRQDQQNIGRSCRSFDALWKIGRRFLYGASDFALKRRLRWRQNAGGLGRRSAWQRGSCGCRCGNDGSGTEQPTAANFDLAHRRWGTGLLVRFLFGHCVLRGCKAIQSERRGLATTIAQRSTIGRALRLLI